MSKQIKNGVTSSKRFNVAADCDCASDCSCTPMAPNMTPVGSGNMSANGMPKNTTRMSRGMVPCWNG